MNTCFSPLGKAGLFGVSLLFGSCAQETAVPATAPTAAPTSSALVCGPRPESSDYQLYPLGDQLAPIGDVMPYFDSEANAFKVYYLKDIWNDATHQRHPWWGLSTSNFVSYAGLPVGEALSCSTQGCEQDYALGTGSITKKGSTYYAYYTGHNPNYPSGCVSHKEGVMLATSRGLGQKFAKDPGFTTIYAPTGQGFDEQDNFRDPFVFRDDASNRYQMLVSARKNVNGTWRGVIARYTSPNLKSWTYAGILYDGGATNYFMLETPEVFKLGDTYYLLFSDIDTKHVYYRKGPSATGPWSLPTGPDRFEGNGIYAAKTAADNYDRYLFGWTNRLGGSTDGGNWQWGGNLVAHKLYQKANKDLAVSIPHTLKSHLEAQSEPLIKDSQWGNVTNITPNTHSYTLSSPANQDVANVLFNPIAPVRYKLHATVSYSSANKDFGFLLGACDGYDDVYSLRFVPGQQRFSLDKTRRSALTTTTVATNDVPFPLAPDTEYRVDIVFENSMVVVYLNNEVALSSRVYRAAGTSWGLFVDNSTATFKNITVTKP
ncbi:glycoside hydrolase family 32 protein [Hymenobacter norwichensis]|uniref:glycoside hydrolase family 32 protein n=1 Tax=Hymenobacter norwichensis TaxID=223903 RepID=UPI0003B59E20|nr:glycoside hydrolase family 32 protein [Hymenobacter norwichensis]